MRFKKLTDSDLEDLLKKKALEERKLTLEIIELLEEVDRRKIFLERGYASLIEYCIKELKYSESSAYRRISAMRVVRDVPQTKTAIVAGELNLVSVAKAQSFFRSEAKAQRVYSPENKRELLRQLQNKSTREADGLLYRLSPEYAERMLIAKVEKVIPVSANRAQLTVLLPGATVEKLDRLKNLLSHKLAAKGDGDLSYACVIDEVVDMAIGKLGSKVSKTEGQAKFEMISPPSSPQHPPLCDAPPAVVSRYIPAQVRRLVWQKSKGQCGYVDPQSKRRCESRRYLEIDHIKPYSAGGTNSAENLQLLCDGHNRWKGSRALRGLSTR